MLSAHATIGVVIVVIAICEAEAHAMLSTHATIGVVIVVIAICEAEAHAMLSTHASVAVAIVVIDICFLLSPVFTPAFRCWHRRSKTTVALQVIPQTPQSSKVDHFPLYLHP